MKAEELYNEYRQCGEAYWLELPRKDRERWERVFRIVGKEIDDAYIRGWNDGTYCD